MIRLVVVDVGHTLGVFGKPSSTDVLKSLSPLPEHVIREEERRVLHRAPELTNEVIQDICDALLIPRSQWPETWPAGRFTAFDYTMTVLAELTLLAPVAALSNIGVTCGPGRMSSLREQCGDLLSGVFTSYELRCRKPAPWLWRHIADRYGVPVQDLVHVGDLWHNDICGAITAGARAIFLTRTRHRAQQVPPPQDWPAGADRIAVVDDLRQVPGVIQAWNDA